MQKNRNRTGKPRMEPGLVDKGKTPAIKKNLEIVALKGLSHKN